MKIPVTEWETITDFHITKWKLSSTLIKKTTLQSSNWPKCRDQGSVECSVINRTSMLFLLCTGLRIHFLRKNGEIVRARGRKDQNETVSSGRVRTDWWIHSSCGYLHKTEPANILGCRGRDSQSSTIPNWRDTNCWWLPGERETQFSLGLWSLVDGWSYSHEHMGSTPAYNS